MLIPFHSVAMYFCLRWKLSSYPVWTQMWTFYFLIDTCLVLLRKAFISYASLIYCPKSFLMQQESDIGSNNPTPPLKISETCTFILSHHCTCALLPWSSLMVTICPASSLCKSLYVCLLASLTVQISFLFQFVHLYVHYYDLKKLCR